MTGRLVTRLALGLLACGAAAAQATSGPEALASDGLYAWRVPWMPSPERTGMYSQRP